MSIVERLYAPISEAPESGRGIDAFDIKDPAIALTPARRWKLVFMANAASAGSAFARPCARFTPFVVKSATSRTARHRARLKQTLLSNWRSEIAHLYAGRPRAHGDPQSERSHTSVRSVV